MLVRQPLARSIEKVIHGIVGGLEAGIHERMDEDTTTFDILRSPAVGQQGSIDSHR